MPPDTPSTITFTACGQTFTADIEAEPEDYFAQVRGHSGCYTEADTIPELRKALVEVVEGLLFDKETGIDGDIDGHGGRTVVVPHTRGEDRPLLQATLRAIFREAGIEPPR